MGASSKLLLPFLLLVLLLATGTRLGEARVCETASRRFRGLCVSRRNCESVCQTEGFPGGNCRGLRRRCMCTRPCLDDDRP